MNRFELVNADSDADFRAVNARSDEAIRAPKNRSVGALPPFFKFVCMTCVIPIR